MSEINSWDTTAANNNSTSPDGWPENMPFAGVNNSGREMMAAIARWYADSNGTLTTGGSSDAYTLTPNRTISAYAAGQTFSFKASFANTGAATINVSSLGAKDIKDVDGNALSAGDIALDRYYTVFYQGTYFVLCPIFSPDDIAGYTHPNHSGDVTSVADGATTLTVDAITSKTALTSGVAGTDELLLNDGGVIKRMDVSVLYELMLARTATGAKSVAGAPYCTEGSLSDGATVTWTPNTDGVEATVTLGGNRTLDLAAIPSAGTYLTIRVVQDGTGSRTLAYSADFDFGDAGSPTLSTAAGAEDLLTFRSNGTVAQFIGAATGFA